MNTYQPTIVTQTIIIDTEAGANAGVDPAGVHAIGTMPPPSGDPMRWIIDRGHYNATLSQAPPGESRALHFATDDLGDEGELLSITGWIMDDEAVALLVDGHAPPANPVITEKMVQSMYIYFAAFDFNKIIDTSGAVALEFPSFAPPTPTSSFYVSDMVYANIGEGITITAGGNPGPRYPFLQETFKTPITYKRSPGGDLGVGIAWLGEDLSVLGVGKRNVIELQLTARKFR